jgi:hypothetical protein
MAKTEPRQGRVSGDGAISERPPSPLDTPGGADPVASLFSADRTLPAPVVAPEANESELTRWKAARDSLFGESVKDPPPPTGSAASARGQHTGPLGFANKLQAAAPEPPEALAPPPAAAPVRAAPVAKIGVGPETQRMSTGRRAPVELAAEPGPAPLESEQLPKLEPPKSRTRAASAPVQAPAAAGSRGDAPAAAPRRADATPGKRPAGARQRKPTPPATMRKEEPERAESEVRSARRFKRGPKPLLLGALGLAVLATGGIAAVFLGVVPDPLADAAVEAPLPPRPATPKLTTDTAAPAPAPAPLPTPAEAVDEKPSAAQANVGKPGAKPIAAAPVAVKPQAKSELSLADDGDASDSAALLANARKALADDNASGAEALARRALAREPDDHHAMEVLARALIDQDRGPEAVVLARRIVEKRKKRVPYRLLLGDALLMTGDQAGARNEWQAAAALEPSNREVQQRLR